MMGAVIIRGFLLGLAFYAILFGLAQWFVYPEPVAEALAFILGMFGGIAGVTVAMLTDKN